MIYYGVATAESQSIKKEAGIDGSLKFGQKNISTLKRNLLNADEILRIPYNQLLVNIRGNKPLLLEKMIYTEHELASQLKNVSVSEYKPIWNKNEFTKPVIKEKPKIKLTEENTNNDNNYKETTEEITFENF